MTTLAPWFIFSQRWPAGYDRGRQEATIVQTPPTPTALELCDEIFATNMRRRFTAGWLQCFVCGRLTLRSCLESERGCNLVNKVYRQRQAAATKEQK